MNNKKAHQLTPYETRIYFFPDTTAIDQRKNQLNALNAQLNAMNTQASNQLKAIDAQLNALNAQLNAINTQANNQLNAQLNAINAQTNNQLNGINNQLNTLNSQLNTINAEEKFIRGLKFKGLRLIIIDLIHSMILAVTYPFIKFYSVINLDPHWCQLLYFILLLIEAYFIKKAKKIKKFYLYFILFIFTLLIYFNFLINSQNIETTTFFFYFCAIFHIYPLYIGISLVYTASQKREKNLEEVQQKKLQQKKLQQRKTQVKEEQQKKLQQKKAQVKEEQRKEIQQKKLEIAQLQQKKLQVEEEQRKKLQQKEKELQELQRKDIQQTPPPTDQEFDAWLENRVREGLASTIHKLGLEDMIANPRELLRVRGYILPGMRDARDYRPQDLLYKLGADGKRRYSINLYTYFYPANNRIMVFTYEINAMNWNDYRETTREYFYQDVIGATTEDNHDKLYIDGKPQSYRTQRFSLRLCDGTAISATVRSRPLDVASLPVFDIDPESDIDKTIAYLRLVLREKKA